MTTVATEPLTLAGLLAKHETAIAAALALTPLSLVEFQVALQSAAIADPAIERSVRDNPDSVLACVMEAAQLGLRPGRSFGHYALLSRCRDGKWSLDGALEYRGLIHLADRCNVIEELTAQVVYRGEPFRYDTRTREIDHDPFVLDDDVDRSPANLVGCYAIVRIRGRARPCIAVMRRVDIERVREHSSSWQAYRREEISDTAWVTDETEMWKKAVLKKVLGGGEVPIASAAADLVRHHDAPAGASAAPQPSPPVIDPPWEISLGSPAMAEGKVWIEAFNGRLRVCRQEFWHEPTPAEEQALRASLLRELGADAPKNPHLTTAEIATDVVHHRRHRETKK